MQKALTLNLTTGIIQNSSVPFINIDDRPVFLDIVNSGSIYITGDYLASGNISISGNIFASGNAHIMGTLLVDSYIYPFGVRAARNASLAQAVYVPWITGEDSSFALIYAGSSNNSNGQVSIYGESYSAVGVVGYAPAGTGVQGTSSVGYGVNAISTGAGYGLFAQAQSASSGLPILAQKLGNSDSPQVASTFEYWKSTGGTAAAGIGVSLQFNASTTEGSTPPTAGYLDAIWSTVTHASRTSNLVIRLVNNAGSPAEVARFTPVSLGLGTNAPTVRLTLKGTDSNYAAGPHAEFITSADAHPQFQVLPYAHDNINVSFDAYFDGSSWKSSDAGSNFQFRKSADQLAVYYDSGVTAGSAITWVQAWYVTTGGMFVVPGTIRTDNFFQQVLEDNGTTSLVTGLQLIHQNDGGGTPSTGFGTAITFSAHSSNHTLRNQSQIYSEWDVATDGSRQGRIRFIAIDSVGGREFLRGTANGSAVQIGFFASAGTTKQTVTGSRGGNAALASLLTALAGYGLITNSSSA